MRFLLEQRGIDLVEMQLQIYRKAIDAFDNGRGQNDKSDAGPQYLAVANTAVATLARYSYPTMTAIKIEDLDNDINKKVIDATEVRKAILNDPFSKSIADAATVPQEIGLPVLSPGKKND
jgi:hypothetical protein